jgi:hypothetical protein
MVLGTGFEPARLTATASKTVVYANSTTRASNREPTHRFVDQCWVGNPVVGTSSPEKTLQILMKTTLSSLLAIAALAPATLLFNGCSRADKDNAATVGQDIKSTAIDSWDSIKDYTFEKKTEFSAYMSRMDDSMDAKVADLKAKGKTVPDYDDAKVDLKKSLNDLNNATADTWADAKAKTERAWDRVKADYDKATN